MGILEDQARRLGESKAELKKRLRDAKSVYDKSIQKKFSKEKMNFIRKCMISDDGSLELCWKLRDKPDEPSSYRNWQTSIGVVRLQRRRI